jgi:menaquinone-dependent protoporphyrinogen oxidase
MRVLVAYGSKMGGTRGLAETIGESFQARGIDVVVLPAAEVRSPDGFDVVVLGGALYAGRWHRDARRFAARHRAALHDLPVWLFSSGPLDDSATEREIPPVRQARKVMDRLGAEAHVTFGGRLEASPVGGGWMARAMAKKAAGDWRDAEQVDAWVDGIADAVRERGEASEGARPA